LALALVGLVASPALADLGPSQYTPTLANLGAQSGHTVGVWDGGSGIYTNIIQPANVSDVFTVEFAFHWPYVTSVNMIQFWSSIVWDSDEIQITGIGPFGVFPAWGAANYDSASFVTFVSGITNVGVVQVGDVLGTGVPLWQNPSGGLSGSTLIAGSQVIPFMAVQFHVFNPVDDGYLDLVIGSAAMLFTSGGTTYWTGGAIGATSYGIAITPEPASLSLLAGGILAIGAGIWRRRR
jgi:hypothetical protein